MTTTQIDTRAAIVAAGARLLRQGGPEAMTTRGVAEQAGVQAPAIYRLFGDKDGLLEAVAEHVMAGFVSAKATGMATATSADADPVEDLRASWHRQIDFGLANPAVFRLLSDPDRVRHSPAARAGREILAARVRRLATSGRLRVPEARAVGLIHAAGVGAIQVLLATPVDERDPELAATMLQAVLGAIVDDDPAASRTVEHDAPMAAAVTLRAAAPHLDALTGSERRLLTEWLDRVTNAPGAG